ncbi:hypothetical protein SAMN05216436_10341 [bacterium A37T11]|nr:hypothetical protein SAMN05216436_10341 [bacterium A37T11]
MEIYLRDKKAQVDQKKRAANAEIARRLRTNNLAGDMAIHFIKLQKTGEYPYKTQGEAADAYVAVHISKNGNEVSPQTLMKHDKTALYMPAKKWYDKVVEIAKYLKKEYGFKD